MAIEPTDKRAVAFIDGQNLYRHAKDAFGYHFPNYDPNKLHNAVCGAQGWRPHGVRFYTGTPLASKSPMWHGFWASKLLSMRRAGIHVYSRPIRYYSNEFELPDGSIWELDTSHEKGVDVRLSLDVVRLARSGQFDVAVIFSQDQDLAEVAEEVKDISRSYKRWLKVVSAFPTGPNASTKRGIDKTDWLGIDKAFYDQCLDLYDYRPKPPATPHPVTPPIRRKEPPP
jgi:uncharacterized LabA/DUF88 family protein